MECSVIQAHLDVLERITHTKPWNGLRVLFCPVPVPGLRVLETVHDVDPREAKTTDQGGTTMSELVPWARMEEERFPSLFRGRFFREFDDLMHRFFKEEPFFTGRAQTFQPAIDVSETDEEFVVKGEIPGIDPKELDVSVTGQVLTIKGEKQEEKEEKDEGTYRKERRFGSFSRSITIPCEIQEDKIEAKFQNGVISLRLPKKETTKKRSIQIEVND